MCTTPSHEFLFYASLVLFFLSLILISHLNLKNKYMNLFQSLPTTANVTSTSFVQSTSSPSNPSASPLSTMPFPSPPHPPPPNSEATANSLGGSGISSWGACCYAGTSCSASVSSSAIVATCCWAISTVAAFRCATSSKCATTASTPLLASLLTPATTPPSPPKKWTRTPPSFTPDDALRVVLRKTNFNLTDWYDYFKIYIHSYFKIIVVFCV